MNNNAKLIIVCGSTHHLISAISYIECIKNKFNITNILILNDTFLNNIYTPDPEFIFRLEKLVNLKLDVKNFKDGFNFYLYKTPREKCRIFYLTPRFFSINIYLKIYLKYNNITKKLPLTWIETEEGLGSYASSIYRIKQFIKDGRYIHAIKYIINNILGYFFIKNRLRILSVVKDKKVLITNKETKILYYILYKDTNIHIDLPDGYKGIMLFAAQPAVELKWMQQEEYMDFIQKIRQDAASRSLFLLIKKHPSEFAVKYKKDILYKSDYLEFEKIIINDKRIKAVATICSTTLYTSKVIKDIETYIYVNKNLHKRFFEKPTNHMSVLKKLANNFVIV